LSDAIAIAKIMANDHFRIGVDGVEPIGAIQPLIADEPASGK